MTSPGSAIDTPASAEAPLRFPVPDRSWLPCGASHDLGDTWQQPPNRAPGQNCGRQRRLYMGHPAKASQVALFRRRAGGTGDEGYLATSKQNPP